MFKAKLLFNTIRFLKPIQVYYRIFYWLRKKVRLFTKFKYPISKKSNCVALTLKASIHNHLSYLGENRFSFLNIEHTFKEEINWDIEDYGKLWTYNLTYFDYLNQDRTYNYEELFEDFITNQESISVGFEPFPIALRGLNWIKYLTYHQVDNSRINDSLYAQYDRLKDNLEYHLLGNHLLENGFSLLFAAYYFKDDSFYGKAKDILENELVEQVLDDGAHFELTPMYHQIMLFRLLDCINLLQNNTWKDDELLVFLTKKSKVMLSWLEQITYENGDIPLVNDSANSIAPSSEALFKYATSLGLKYKLLAFSSSGYRKVLKENYEALVDVGCIGASYIPGHVHSDMLSFEVYKNKKPFIVDTGLSTYESNERRMFERGTSAHNTVEINGSSQSGVWGGFRVANRAKIIFLEEKEDYIEATHDGYKKDNIIHNRVWKFNENTIEVVDKLSLESNAVAYIHFHPDVDEDEIHNSMVLNQQDYELSKYQYAKGFNSLVQGWCIQIRFSKTLNVVIDVR